ncbi:MAG: glycosyl transferase family 2, partial [Flavobacteriales bacterium]
GLSLHNSLAVLEGYTGKKSPFVRTPKFSLTHKSGNWKGKQYSKIKLNWVTLFEGLLATYFAIGMYLCFEWQDYGMLPLFTMLTLGFSVISMYSIKHSLVR